MNAIANYEPWRNIPVPSYGISFDKGDPSEIDSIVAAANNILMCNTNDSIKMNDQSKSNETNSESESENELSPFRRQGIHESVSESESQSQLQPQPQIQAGPNSNRCWRVKDEEVFELPEIYPRLSSPLIVRGFEVSEIGERLWAILRVHDIRSVYDSPNGRVLCYTHRVSFVVQFWRRRVQTRTTIYPAAGNTSNNETTNDINSNNNSNSNSNINNPCHDEEEIILEIQRRQGCSWAMHKIRSALKKAMIHQPHNHQHRRHTHPPSFSSPPERRNSNSNSLDGVGMIRYEPLPLPILYEPLPLPIPYEVGGGERIQKLSPLSRMPSADGGGYFHRLRPGQRPIHNRAPARDEIPFPSI